MLTRQTILKSGFRSIIALGPLNEAPPRQLRHALDESRRTAGESGIETTVTSFRIPGIGRAVMFAGRGWSRTYYCDRIPAHA